MPPLLFHAGSADEWDMREQRRNTRMLCAELVEITYQDLRGHERHEVGNLDDIAVHGACLQIEYALPLDTPVVIEHERGQLTGVVRHCAHRDGNHFIGVEFDPGCTWNREEFEPEHLLNPRQLFEKTLARYDQEHPLAGEIV